MTKKTYLNYETGHGNWQARTQGVYSSADTTGWFTWWAGFDRTGYADGGSTSVSTPGWPKKGRLPDNDYSQHQYLVQDPEVEVNIAWIRREDVIQDAPGSVHKFDFYKTNAKLWGARQTQGPLADNPYPGLVVKLHDKLNLSKTNTAVAMAELHKTAAHISKTASRLARSILALKRLQFGTFAKELGLADSVREDMRKKYLSHSRKSLLLYKSEGGRAGLKSRAASFTAESWLEYSYAWKPLLKDVYDHADALAQTCVERQWVMREAKAHNQTKLDTPRQEVPGGNVWDYWWSSQDEWWQAMEVRYSIPPGTVSAVRAFGLQNPLEVAWELVPFSFVVDWFLPIGDAIRGLTATNGLTFHSGWYTTRHVHKLRSGFYGNGRRYTSGSLRAEANGSAEREMYWFDMVRTNVVDFPHAQFPQWKDWRGNGRGDVLKDSSHGLSAIALLKTVVLDKREDIRRLIR